jgi:two-component system nitrogen regulation sensor histidine kinase GlnL
LGSVKKIKISAGHEPPPKPVEIDPRHVVDALPLVVLVLDSRDRIQSANATAEPFFSLSITSLTSMRLDDLIPADSPLFMMIRQVRANGGTIVEHDLTLESPRLSKHDVIAQATLLTDQPGALLLTLQDSTSLRALDRRLTFRNAARSVAGMAAILAHEVKNPLSGIRGAAQLLEGSAVSAGDRELAVLIREEADRIRFLVDRMEMFGEKPIERRPVNIHRVLEHVRMLAHSGFAAHIRIVERYDPSLPSVAGNRDQLVQVLLNLVKNAAEAISDDGGTGEITLITAYRHGLRLVVPGSTQRVHLPLLVTVRDTGPGIPDDIKPHLFEPFITSKATGSGLGLALAAKIVGDHGGMIEIDSHGGRTEVRLHLPVLSEDYDPAPAD